MRLGVTRPADQLGELANLAAARGITIVPLPLFRIEPVAFDWPLPSARDGVDWLVFTSANGVSAFFDALHGQGATIDPRIRIAVIGPKTAEALQPYRTRVHYAGREAHGESLFSELASGLVHPAYTLVYARAEEISFDPEEILKAASINYIPLVCYRSVPLPLQRNLIDEFSADDYILFTAPSTVHQYQHLFGQPAARPVAIGRTTGSAMKTAGWRSAVALPRPEIEAVLECLV